MDPLGFGLENFDGIGSWRSEDGEFPIEATGSLPDGRSFEGPAGLRKILVAERQSFVEALTEKLLTYALGRGRFLEAAGKRQPHRARHRTTALRAIDGHERDGRVDLNGYGFGRCHGGGDTRAPLPPAQARSVRPRAGPEEAERRRLRTVR